MPKLKNLNDTFLVIFKQNELHTLNFSAKNHLKGGKMEYFPFMSNFSLFFACLVFREEGEESHEFAYVVK